MTNTARVDMVARVMRLRPVRVWQRYADARGNVLSAGVAYFGFLSLFPTLALAAAVGGFLLADRPALRSAVADRASDLLPGVLATPQHPDGLVEVTMPATLTLGITGIVAVVVLTVGGLGWVGSLRGGIRILLGSPRIPGRYVFDKLRDLGVFLLLGISLLASSTLTLVVGDLAGVVAGWPGIAEFSESLPLVSLAASFLLNAAAMVLLLRVLTGIRLPWRALRSGVVAGGAGLTVLELGGSLVIRYATRNPVFGSVVFAVGLLVWLNVVAKLILYTAAWTAEAVGAPGPSDLLDAPSTGAPATAVRSALLTDDPGGVDPLNARDRAGHGLPTFDRRDQDRVSLAAGAVIGAAAAVTLGALGRTARRLLGAGPRVR